MSENIIILMIGVSTFLGALGLIALLWGVKSGQFDDHSKFIDATRFDNEEDLRDAAMMDQKRKARKKEKKEKKEYMPPD
ncbi:MAG: cbb3-type cytochrome oxidase assembly protein CcoS [Sulfurovum sp.]|nr:MAG: cbb3-type cytochrome oxidase assembly protein CcoS [Sulfurovum sp.]